LKSKARYLYALEMKLRESGVDCSGLPRREYSSEESETEQSEGGEEEEKYEY
jgi:hypothetical protein